MKLQKKKFSHWKISEELLKLEPVKQLMIKSNNRSNKNTNPEKILEDNNQEKNSKTRFFF